MLELLLFRLFIPITSLNELCGSTNFGCGTVKLLNITNILYEKHTNN